MTPKRVLVFPASAESSPIWPALERLVNVRFAHSSQVSDCSSADGVVLLEPNADATRLLSASGISSFSFSNAEASEDRKLQSVRFSDSLQLDSRLRGKRLSHCPIPVVPINEAPDVSVLAWDGQAPIWARRSKGAVRTECLACEFPELSRAQQVLDYFHGERFFELLPLLHFLREVAGPSDWQSPGLRACFMFDDPNIHWPSYGYLAYEELAASATAHHFHIALATVPLDTWFVHQKTASLFRNQTSTLSLLFHGNDHLCKELGVQRGSTETRALLAQSLKRISQFEQRSGLLVDRVMAPPHEACTPGMIEAMLELGFDGGCISPWSLRDWGGEHPWPDSFGLEPTELVFGTCPVAPRFKMSADCLGNIVVSAFLNRPIIPVGHHYSVAGGLELLAVLAKFINSLGKVNWCNLQSILRGSFLTRQEGSTLFLRPYSACLDVRIPDEIDTLMLTCPLNQRSRNQFKLLPHVQDSTRFQARLLDFNSPVHVTPGEKIRLVSSAFGTIDFRQVKSPSAHPWAFVRRLLCEFRDRLQPLRPSSTASQTTVASS